MNITKNIKSHFFNTIILLPILWSFTGMFLYPNGKKAIVVLILIAAITSFFLYGFKNISNNLKYNKLLWLLAASSAFAIAADFYYGYSSSQLRAFISVFIYLTILPPSITDKINLKFLTIAGAITSLTFTLTQVYIYHHQRLWDINPIPYATFVATIAILGFYFLLQSENAKQRILWVIVFASTLIPLFYSQTRGLWLALSVAMLTLLLKSLAANKKRGALLIPIAIILTISFSMRFDTVTERIEQTNNEILQIMKGNLNTSIGLRLQLWQTAIYLTGESPIIGLGDKHMERKKELAAHNIISPSILPFPHYHNQFLNALVKYGIVGLSLLLCSIFLPVYYFFKNDSQYKWPGFLVVLIFVVAALTDVPFQHAQTLTLYFFISYITLCAPDAHSTKPSTQRDE